jgi:uncharacterized protein
MVADLALGPAAGLVITTVTARVGGRGCVHETGPTRRCSASQLGRRHTHEPPVQRVGGPGSLLRFRRGGHPSVPRARLLLAGTVRGMILGAVIRAFLVPRPEAFRVSPRLVLLTLRVWLVPGSSGRWRRDTSRTRSKNGFGP